MLALTTLLGFQWLLAVLQFVNHNTTAEALPLCQSNHGISLMTPGAACCCSAITCIRTKLVPTKKVSWGIWHSPVKAACSSNQTCQSRWVCRMQQQRQDDTTLLIKRLVAHVARILQATAQQCCSIVWCSYHTNHRCVLHAIQCPRLDMAAMHMNARKPPRQVESEKLQSPKQC